MFCQKSYYYKQRRKIGFEKKIENMPSFICQVVSNFDKLQLKESLSSANENTNLEEDMYRHEMYRCVYDLYNGRISTNVGSRFGCNGITHFFLY